MAAEIQEEAGLSFGLPKLWPMIDNPPLNVGLRCKKKRLHSIHCRAYVVRNDLKVRIKKTSTLHYTHHQRKKREKERNKRGVLYFAIHWAGVEENVQNVVIGKVSHDGDGGKCDPFDATRCGENCDTQIT